MRITCLGGLFSSQTMYFCLKSRWSIWLAPPLFVHNLVCNFIWLSKKFLNRLLDSKNLETRFFYEKKRIDKLDSYSNIDYSECWLGYPIRVLNLAFGLSLSYFHLGLNPFSLLEQFILALKTPQGESKLSVFLFIYRVCILFSLTRDIGFST